MCMSVIILISISKIVTIVLVAVRGGDYGKAQGGQLGKQGLQRLLNPRLLSRKMQEVFINAGHQLTSKNVGLWNITFRVVGYFWGGGRGIDLRVCKPLSHVLG